MYLNTLNTTTYQHIGCISVVYTLPTISAPIATFPTSVLCQSARKGCTIFSNTLKVRNDLAQRKKTECGRIVNTRSPICNARRSPRAHNMDKYGPNNHYRRLRTTKQCNFDCVRSILRFSFVARPNGAKYVYILTDIPS